MDFKKNIQVIFAVAEFHWYLCFGLVNLEVSDTFNLYLRSILFYRVKNP